MYECHKHTPTCQHHNMRVEITLVCVEITVVSVIITFFASQNYTACGSCTHLRVGIITLCV
jgi:hypothetical protein